MTGAYGREYHVGVREGVSTALGGGGSCAAQKWVRSLQLFFYAAFIVLWFKDNFGLLRKLPVSYLWALLPFLVLTGYRLCFMIRQGRVRLPPGIFRGGVGLLVLLLLATILRLPYLAFPNGMMNSDDAIMALMGKHIAEGKVPPVCFYGQLYLGSLSSHLYALAFQIFGYSVLVLKCVTLAIYLAFIAAQFVLLREVFSVSFALAVGFFYSLPITPLLVAGFDNTSAYPLVLLLGSLLLYLAYLISFRQKEKLIPALGFLMGTAFWTHEVTAALILTSFIIVTFKLKSRIRRYATLIGFAILGFLPQLLIEIFNRFQLAGFLTQGKRALDWNTVKAMADFTVSLLAADPHPWRYVVPLFLVSGFAYLVVLCLKKRAFLPQAVFSLFTFLFFLLYLCAHFSAHSAVRYFYPLYISLPVLFLAILLGLKSRVRTVLAFGLVALLFIVFNLRTSLLHFGLVKDEQARLSQTVGAMQETGQRYWTADYWTAYLLTAVTGEELVVDALYYNRYPAYTLAYYDQTEKDNFVYLLKDRPSEEARYRKLLGWLEAFDIPAKKKDVADCRLVYDLGSRFYPAYRFREIPPQFPHLEIDKASTSNGYLYLVFKNQTVGEDVGFRLRLAIPGFSSSSLKISLADAEVKARLPCPPGRGLSIHYALDFAGIVIPATVREFDFSPLEEDLAERQDPLVCLRGLGYGVLVAGQHRLICEKEISWEINRPAGDHLTVRIFLYSPFDFSGWCWYGRYSQGVTITLNQSYSTERVLKDGKNTVRLFIPKKYLKDRGNIITLKFKYADWFPWVPAWEIAAFLDRIELF